MRIEYKRYFLHQIAKKLGGDRFEQEEKILIALGSGEIIASIEDESFEIDIPKDCWRYWDRQEFALFAGPKGEKGKDVYLSPSGIMRVAYRERLQRIDDEVAPDNKFGFLNNLLKSATIRPDDEIVIDEDGNALQDVGPPAAETGLGHSVDLKILQSIRKKLESNFVEKLSMLPVYVSRESWENYLAEHAIDLDGDTPNGKWNAKGGRDPDKNWIPILFYLIQCILHHESAKSIHELLGIDRTLGRLAVAKRLHYWLRKTEHLPENAAPMPYTIADRFADIEKLQADFSVMFPLPSPDKPKKVSEDNRKTFEGGVSRPKAGT
jgi:hypothetical protein